MTHRKGDQGGGEHETKQAVLATLAKTLIVVLSGSGRAGAAVRVAASAYGAWYFREPRIAMAAFAVMLAYGYFSTSWSGHDHHDDEPTPP